jgi:hypothetical protein
MIKSEEHQIILALQALQSNKKLTIRKAAKIYNISYTTLNRRKQGRSNREAFTIKIRKLTILEEQVVLQRILDLDSQAFSPRLSEVQDMANLLLRDRDAERVGINWASRLCRDNHSSKQFYRVNMTIRGLFVRIQRLFALGLTLFGTLQPSMAS